MTHQGLDLSNWQGTLDVGQFPEIEFVTLKATQGMAGNSNPYFDWQYANAKAHGKHVAGYLFVDTSASPEAQAQVYIDRVAGKDLCFHWVDVETNYGGLSPTAYADFIVRLMAVLRTHFGLRVGIYTGAWFWNPATGYLEYSGVPLWDAGYTATLPQLPVGWDQALIWQYTDSYAGRLHGLDASHFLGTEAQWQFYIDATVPTPPKPIPTNTKIAVLEAIVHIPATGVWTRDLDKRLMGIRAVAYNAAGANGNRKNPAAVKYAQQVMAFPAAQTDSVWGPQTQQSVITYVKKIQTALGCPDTGTWDTATEFSFLVIDPLR